MDVSREFNNMKNITQSSSNTSAIRFHFFSLRLFMAALLTLTISPAYLSAQAGDANLVDADEPERASYLQRQHAAREVDDLRTELPVMIQKLNIVIANFGGDVATSKPDFEKIRETYRNAANKYLRGRYVEAQAGYADCRRQIQELFKKFCDKYKEKSITMLTECSDKVAAMELSQTLLPGQNVRAATSFQAQASRMRMAQGHLNMAEERENVGRYDVAIDHFRLCKLFAINILTTLEDSNSKKDAVISKYKVDTDDADGYISQGHASSGGNAAPAPAQAQPQTPNR